MATSLRDHDLPYDESVNVTGWRLHHQLNIFVAGRLRATWVGAEALRVLSDPASSRLVIDRSPLGPA